MPTRVLPSSDRRDAAGLEQESGFGQVPLPVTSSRCRHGKWLRASLSLGLLSVSERICERKRTGALRLE